MNEWLSTFGDLFSIWNVTRAAAITSYLLLFISMLTGLTFKLPIFPKKMQKIILNTHEAAGWFGLLFGMVHGLVLVFDTEYTSYTIFNILIPFTVEHNVISLSLGIFAFYGFLLLVLSTDFLKKIGKKMWRAIHFLAFPTFYAALLHGLLLGTDSQSTWMLILYIFTGATVFILTILRIVQAMQLKKKPIMDKKA